MDVEVRDFDQRRRYLARGHWIPYLSENAETIKDVVSNLKFAGYVYRSQRLRPTA